MNKETAYDKLMYKYYDILNNAWKKQIKLAAREAIINLSAISKGDRADAQWLEDTMYLIDQSLGAEFAAAVTNDTKTFLKKSLEYGLDDVKLELPVSVSIGFYGAPESRLVGLAQKQHLFWVGEHFSDKHQEKFSDALTTAMRDGLRNDELADILKDKFSDLKKKGSAYWQGLAEHTSLRIREFGRLEGYRKAGAIGYMLVNPMDSRTSDICRALVSSGKIYPLAAALEVRDKLLAIDTNKLGIERARDEIKALAPWVKEKDIVYDGDEPIGVNGAHTPFPPFHWKCRTATRVVLD